MRRRGLVLLLTPMLSVGVAAGVMRPLGAAGKVQECVGPSPPRQSGRAMIAPGLNASKAPQQFVLKVSMFSCSPARTTRGAGTLKSTITIKTPQACGLLTDPHALLRANATITWKDDFTSTLALTFSFVGSTHDVNTTGKVIKGLFKDHLVTVRFHYGDLVSGHGGAPSNSEIVQACRNKIAPHKHGRHSIDALTFVTTKSFVIA